MKVQKIGVVVAAAVDPWLDLLSLKGWWCTVDLPIAAAPLHSDPDLCLSLADEDQNAVSSLGLAGLKVLDLQQNDLRTD